MRSRLLLAVVVLGVSVGCGTSTPSSRPTPTPSPSVTRSATPAPTPSATPSEKPTAATALAAFFAAVDRQDARLRAAARLVNGSIGTTRASFSSSTVAAVRATDTKEVADAVPAGLPADLLRAVLLVDSDLVGRSAAMRRVDEYPGPIVLSSEEGKDLLRCLRNGSVLAARFGTDLAAVRSLARRLPAVAVLSRQSRAGLEVAVRTTAITLGHKGCDSCGGTAVPQFLRVTFTAHQSPSWGTAATGWTRFGSIGDLPFRARWMAVPARWEVQLLAC